MFTIPGSLSQQEVQPAGSRLEGDPCSESYVGAFHFSGTSWLCACPAFPPVQFLTGPSALNLRTECCVSHIRIRR
ncbi:hypothetical protein CapIbe_016210 [Capra ibex]